MNNPVFIGLAPHPPIIIPEIGKEDAKPAQKTIDGLTQMAQDLAAAAPETLVIITPHGNVFSDTLTVLAEPEMVGNFTRFNAPDISFKFQNNTALINDLAAKCEAAGLPLVPVTREVAQNHWLHLRLDHGCMVPLYYFVKAGFKGKVVAISIGMLPYLDLYKFGVVLREACQEHGGKTAIIASGDMSHRLTEEAPNGFSPEGQQFDDFIYQALNRADVKQILDISPEFAGKAGECGLRPLIIALGSLDGFSFTSNIYSYEGPFGVGYMSARFIPGEKNESRRFLAQTKAEHLGEINKKRKEESNFVTLARQSLEHYVKHGRPMPVPAEFPEEMQEQAGVFVSIKKHGRLRGCIGTFGPTQPNIGLEIMVNALKAGLEDPRFPSVTEQELPELEYSVDILSPPERVSGLDQLDPKKYGVIVSTRDKRGLLLPDLEGIDTVEEQVEIAKRKAGILPEEKVVLERFEVKRYH